MKGGARAASSAKGGREEVSSDTESEDDPHSGISADEGKECTSDSDSDPEKV